MQRMAAYRDSSTSCSDSAASWNTIRNSKVQKMVDTAVDDAMKKYYRKTNKTFDELERLVLTEMVPNLCFSLRGHQKLITKTQRCLKKLRPMMVYSRHDIQADDKDTKAKNKKTKSTADIRTEIKDNGHKKAYFDVPELPKQVKGEHNRNILPVNAKEYGHNSNYKEFRMPKEPPKVDNRNSIAVNGAKDYGLRVPKDLLELDAAFSTTAVYGDAADYESDDMSWKEREDKFRAAAGNDNGHKVGDNHDIRRYFEEITYEEANETIEVPRKVKKNSADGRDTEDIMVVNVGKTVKTIETETRENKFSYNEESNFVTFAMLKREEIEELEHKRKSRRHKRNERKHPHRRNHESGDNTVLIFKNNADMKTSVSEVSDASDDSSGAEARPSDTTLGRRLRRKEYEACLNLNKHRTGRTHTGNNNFRSSEFSPYVRDASMFPTGQAKRRF